ncbi:LOW QUALITY PROTEIN: alpha-1,3/1,6-mannosyltransferase ALG2-like [Diabrotica virgifera virgifera]|uniref:Alpha-1,3/1,6-mannosyltransferase ALG2 n=1 Tax=Diabrotica virgifera virgifera TaxID=50390 RepID=A0ABM5KXI1_DIAVI|nr:LOW QUALITY PROTEIN: alpha-1,3/1,6-mannosyltransferase ALG2-like [Diabrotica virgifera virgifera]
MEHFQGDNPLDISNTTAVGCNGIATNTGVNNGVISLIEKNLNILTSEFERNEAITDIRFAGKVALDYCAWWIPRTLLGLLGLSVFRSIWMALRLIFFPPDPKPEVVILDVSLIALYILKCFSNYKVFVVETFEELKNTDACYEHTKIIPTLVEAKWIKLADEIIVETLGFAEILVKSHPSIIKKPRILYPSIDLGLWNEPGIKIQRIIPDLLGDTILFLSVGKFKRASNFKLSLDAFEFLLNLIDDSAITKRFQLVVAGNCKTLDERFHYSELMASAKQRVCAAQVTFLRQLFFYSRRIFCKEQRWRHQIGNTDGGKWTRPGRKECREPSEKRHK